MPNLIDLTRQKFNRLTVLSRAENRKKQVNIAQVGELLGHLSDIIFANKTMETEVILALNGKKRAKKKSKVQRTK